MRALPQEPVMSSHGYKVWFSDTLESFPQYGEHVCVPNGWEPVGEKEQKFGWASFPAGASGVLIHSADFTSRMLRTKNDSYVLRVVYQKSLASESVERYITTIVHAFDSVSSLYPSTAGQMLPHTVLITVGVAGDGTEFETSVYPDPSIKMSMFVRNIGHTRGEELFIHAVAHLFNRYREDLISYEDTQSPLPPEDWQESEAAWSEIVFRTSNEGRTRRLAELYDIHTAIQTHTFSDSLIYPFNTSELFDAVMQRSTVIKPDSVYSDYQYGHYVLGPLVMVAIEGLLQKYNTHTDIKTLCTELHTKETSNFYKKLATVLPPTEMEHIAHFMNGEETIPRELIDAGNDYYEKRP